MAAFASIEAAEARVTAKVNDKTWVEGYACRKTNGTIAVRVLRFCNVAGAATFDGMNRDGAWDEITDDATV